MRISNVIKTMKQDAIRYQSEIREYVCETQQVFSAGLVLFFILHIVVLSILDFADHSRLNKAMWISFIQMIFALIWYLSFRYYFSSHRRYVVWAAYLNLFQVLMFLELQYILYNEYMSYTTILCILISTSLTIIGSVWQYSILILFVVCVDIGITILKNPDLTRTQYMQMFLVDNLFLLVITTGINFNCSRLRYQAFEKAQQVTRLSERDGLTDLLNRTAFEQAIVPYCSSRTLGAMILLDLDNFKALNDTLGHFEGDRCLRRVGEVLENVFEDRGYVCRLGGDEFAVFMPNLSDESDVMERTQMLLEQIPQNYPHKTGVISVTCSIGVAYTKMDNRKLDAYMYEILYKAADSAMYKSKAKGKNTVTVFAGDLSALCH